MLENTGCAHKNQGSNSKKTRKNHQKIDSQTYSKKTPQKTSQNSIFTPIWASQNPSKRHQIAKNRQKKPSQKKLVKQSHGNWDPSPETKPFGTQPDHPTTLPMISTSPSIDLPLVALIIKASSATWNAYNHLLSLHNPSRIPPESFQIQSKICKNRFKIANKSHRKPNRVPNAPRYQFFWVFLYSLGGPKPPNIDPKWLKFIKKRKRINVRENYIFQH